MTLDVTEHFELFIINTGHNIFQQSVMAPCAAFGVQCNTTAVQDMIGCLATPAQLAHVRRRLFPSLQVHCCWKGVYRGVKEKFKGSCL